MPRMIYTKDNQCYAMFDEEKTMIELAEKYIGKDYSDEIKELYDHTRMLKDNLNHYGIL